MFISREQLTVIENRIDTLERQVQSLKEQGTFYVASPTPGRSVEVPHSKVLGAIINHLGVEVTAMPPRKSEASIHFTNKPQPK